MRRQRFGLNEIEEMRYEEFCKTHCSPCKIIIEPTGIGDKVTVKCKGCGEEKDISDYDCW